MERATPGREPAYRTPRCHAARKSWRSNCPVASGMRRATPHTAECAPAKHQRPALAPERSRGIGVHMVTSALVSALHVLGIALAFGSIYARRRALKNTPLDNVSTQAALFADTWWGVSAIILIGSGLLRAFAGLEKGAHYYLHNWLFHAKLTAVVVILLLEIWPMITLLRWRLALKRGQAVDASAAGRIARISFVQLHLLAAALIAAPFISRGFAVFGGGTPAP